MRTRIFLADDHGLTRLGLRSLLELSDCQVVGEAADGREALQQILALQPEMALLDVTMPGLNGIEVCAQVRQRCPEILVGMLSMHADTEYAHRALAAGASAYVIKGGVCDDVLHAVRAMRLGRRYLSPGLGLGLGPWTSTTELPANDPLDQLSAREQQVLQLVVEGYSSARIAALVHLSPKSVDTYRSRLMKKLGVADLPGLVKFAIQHGITQIIPGLPPR